MPRFDARLDTKPGRNKGDTFEFIGKNSAIRLFRERHARVLLRHTVGLLRDTKSAAAPVMRTIAPRSVWARHGAKRDVHPQKLADRQCSR